MLTTKEAMLQVYATSEEKAKAIENGQIAGSVEPTIEGMRIERNNALIREHCPVCKEQTDKLGLLAIQAWTTDRDSGYLCGSCIEKLKLSGLMEQLYQVFARPIEDSSCQELPIVVNLRNAEEEDEEEDING